MDILSPLQQNYMEDVKLDELIVQQREMRLCDAKIRLGQYIELQNSLFDEILEVETKDLLMKKRLKRLQAIKNAYKQVSV